MPKESKGTARTRTAKRVVNNYYKKSNTKDEAQTRGWTAKGNTISAPSDAAVRKQKRYGGRR